ncbi:unnamed protein product [Coffea canephora]|uniref:Cyclin n=2 Tax=Coffea TaxID=13442 RepID=A0A068UU44_COFCA|nr:cyclin-U1-1-like [Coffea arabica]CDP11817.1 unnamed protein product [Coffea canephora]
MLSGSSANSHQILHHHNHISRPVPEPSQDEPTLPRVLTILSHVLEKLVARNDQLVQLGSQNQSQQKWINETASYQLAGKSLKGFDGVRAPSISIGKYMERIYKYTNCSPSCFVVGYVYIDRLVHKYPDSLVVSLNVHRLLVTCVMVASKMLDDVHYNNAIYARVGGVTNAELNRLELELLFLLDFGVTISSQVFEIYCQHLEKEMLRNEAAIDYYYNNMARPAITNSTPDATEISIEDHAQSSSSHE